MAKKKNGESTDLLTDLVAFAADLRANAKPQGLISDELETIIERHHPDVGEALKRSDVAGALERAQA